MIKKLKTFLSKKLLITIFTAAFVWANNKWQLGLTEDSISNIVIVIVGYIIGQTAVDIAAVRTPDAPNPPSVGELDTPHGTGAILNVAPDMSKM